MRFAEGMSPKDVSAEEIRRMLEAAERYVEVDASPLERVVAIGESAEAGVVRYELIALELRAAGGILHWKAHTQEQAMLGQADVAVSDDRGTPFDAFPASGGGDKVWSGTLNITPRPVDGSRLHVELRGFKDPGLPFAPLPATVAGARTAFDFAI